MIVGESKSLPVCLPLPAIVSSVKCAEEGKFEGKHKTGSSIIKQTQLQVVVVIVLSQERNSQLQLHSKSGPSPSIAA